MSKLEQRIIDLFRSNYNIGYIRTRLSSSGFQVPDWLMKLQSEQCAQQQLTVAKTHIPELAKYIKECDHCHSECLNLADVYNVEDDIEHWCNICSSSDAYYWDDDGCYHTTPEPRDVIAEYHENDRGDWNKKVNWKDETLLGLEIETFIPGNSNKLRDKVTNAVQNFDIFAERDGSLDDENGVEFVFMPVPYDQIVDNCFIHKWADSLLECDAQGWDAGSDYGMHISVNAAAMDQLHVGKFCWFINTKKTLCQKVAGRPQNDYAEYMPNSTNMDTFHDVTDKYLAASRRSRERVEVRIFRSTLRWKSIVKNCQFVDSVRLFTKVADVKNLSVESYFAFLENANNKNKYGILNEFFNLPKFAKLKKV